MNKNEQKKQRKEIELDNRIIKEVYLEMKKSFKKEKYSNDSNKNSLEQYYI
jgi:hypothetical protein